MLKTCSYCGRIHDTKIICVKKPKQKYKNKPTNLDRFRWTNAWKIKRKEIKQRDNYVCQVCVRKLFNYKRQFETDQLSVHHAISLANDYNKRLDDNNLITLCSYHHELAENGDISYELIKSIIDEQEVKKL